MAVNKIGEGVMAGYNHYVELEQAVRNNMPDWYSEQLRAQVQPGFDFDYIARILLVLLGLYLLSSLFAFLMAYIMSSVAQETVYNMRNDVKDKLDRLPLSYFDRHTHGEILSRVTNDMDNIANYPAADPDPADNLGSDLAGILAMMLSISLLMTLIALVTLPLSALVTAVVARYSQRFFVQQQKPLGELNGHVEEMYGGHKIVKLFGHRAGFGGEVQRDQPAAL